MPQSKNPASGSTPDPRFTIASVVINMPPADMSTTGLIERDRNIALHDLQTDSFFHPFKDENGPYDLALRIEDSRLVVDMQNALGADLQTLVLSLKPYRRLIKDYFMIVRSYDEAMREGKPSRIEAIDMGRRALHNEGASLLQERLESKIEMDHDTARRLFTLICALHDSKAMVYRA